MRVRTFVGILVGLAVVVAASYLTHQNVDLLRSPFRLSSQSSVPLYGAVIVVFLAGFLPVVSILVAETLRKDLARRRGRRHERDQDRRRSTLRRALDFAADGQWSRAIAELEAVLSEKPEDFHALIHLGTAQRQLGLFDSAIETHRRACVLYPQSASAVYELAADYDANGEEDVAEEIRDRLLRDFSNLGLRVLALRREAAVESGEWPNALQHHEKLSAFSEQESAGGENLALGLAYEDAVLDLESDRPAQAQTKLEAILDQRADFVPAALMLGEAQLSADREDEALETWKNAFKASANGAFLQRIEDHFIEQADPMRAIETLHSIAAAVGDDLLPRYFIGRLYLRLEMPEEAARSLLAIESRVGHSPVYHSLVARLHDRAGDSLQARLHRETCASQLGLEQSEYVCNRCEARYGSWMARCSECGEWSTVSLDFREVAPPSSGRRAVAKWQAYENLPIEDSE